jgi:hypothetical protein
MNRSLRSLHRVRLPRSGVDPVLHGIESLHCGACSSTTTIKEAMHTFKRQAFPGARRGVWQAMTTFSWGTRGQSDSFAIGRIAPQNVKVAMMLNNANFQCKKCKAVRWVGGFRL